MNGVDCPIYNVRGKKVNTM